MTSCPVCSKPVDPLRSRFVGVRDGKIVGFCSAECAAKGGAGVPVAPAVISQAPALAAAALAAEVDPARMAAQPEPEAAVEVAPAKDAKPGKAGRGKGRGAAQTPASGVPRPAPPAPGVPVSLESGPVIEIIREPATGAVDKPSEPVSAIADKPTGRAKHPDEISMTELWAADKAREATGKPAEPSHARAPSEPELAPPRKSRAPLVILLLVVLAVGGFLVYQHLMKNDASAATRPTPSARAPTHEAGAIGAVAPPTAEPPVPSRPPPLTAPAALDLARHTLDAHLHDTSQRVQHLAATALARIADPAALAALAGALGLAAAPAAPPLETSELAKLDLAYALARGGDQRGAELLAAGLRSVRGDVRDEAARLLVLLGDARGVPHLLDLLQIAQRRLGAAEQLVHLREPHALKSLEQLRADPKTSADDRARATIALGVAGRADVAPALRTLLADLHESAFAAAALAELGDLAARPVLEQQLASPALRVRAARALRRLVPDLDPTPLLAELTAVVTTGRDTDQVQAGEAVLLLTGPAAWATFE